MADSLTCLIVASRYWEYQGGESEAGRKGDKQEKQIGFYGMQSLLVIPYRLKKGWACRLLGEYAGYYRQVALKLA
jgi:hypothetical protein